MRARLREAYAPAELAKVYAKPHDHSLWPDHQLRVAVTVQVAYGLAGKVQTIADLSCGDGAIARSLPADRRIFGDFAPGHEYEGPISQTVWKIPQVSLFVCAETIEHLDEPELILKAIRAKAAGLVLSTPVDAWQDRNPEHYWAWGRLDVEEMLAAAGWTPAVYCELDCRPGGGEYAFGIWGCR